jgi:hypothetical protein
MARYQTSYQIPYQTPYQIPYQTLYQIPYQTLYQISYQTSYQIPYQIPYRTLYQTLYRNDLARFLDHQKERSIQIFTFQHDASSAKFSRRYNHGISSDEGKKTEASIFLIALLEYSDYRTQSTR